MKPRWSIAGNRFGYVIEVDSGRQIHPQTDRDDNRLYLMSIKEDKVFLLIIQLTA